MTIHQFAFMTVPKAPLRTSSREREPTTCSVLAGDD